MGGASTKLYQVQNIGDFRSVVKYGTQPNSRGPTENGYSVLMRKQVVNPGLLIGAPDDPLVIETRGKGRSSWKIYDDDWALHIYVSVDGSKFYDVGLISILKSDANVYVWTYGDRIVIGNYDGKLGRESDKKSFKFFEITREEIKPSDEFP